MTIATNTYTVTVADAHSHSVQLTAQPGNTAGTLDGKLIAIRDALTEAEASGQIFATLNAADTITVTVTQP